MSRLTTNRAPYFDDFSESKGFYKVLFRPSRPIQTRELNQLQSILSNQTEQFANHIFKFGSMVKSGSVRLKQFTEYVRLKDLVPTGAQIDVTRFTGRKVRGKTTGLLAEVVLTAALDDFDPATIYVNYTNTAIDGETSRFLNGETLEVLDANGYVVYESTVRCPDCEVNPDSDLTNPTGFGSLFAVEDSAYYVHGAFVPVNQQMIILNKYDSTPSYNVGFDIVQSIVTSQDDQSLNDNALGTPNFSAPGADRYKIKLVLSKKPLDSGESGENFILLGKVESGVLQEIKDKPQYAELMDTLARRTFDESGDYTVKRFDINFREHLKKDGNGGWKASEDGGDETLFVTSVSAGKAYVRGREIELIAEKRIPVQKARDTESKRTTVIRPVLTNYILIKLDAISNMLPLTNTGGVATPSDYVKINLYDGAASAGNPTGNNIGTTRVKAMELHSGFVGGVGADEPVYKMYIFDTVMGAARKMSEVLSVNRTGGGTQTFTANTVADPADSIVRVYNPNNNTLLFKIPYPFTKSIRDADNALVTNTAVTITKKLIGSVNTSGNVVFVAESNETFLNYNRFKWLGGLQPATGANYAPFNLNAVDAIVVSPSTITVQVGGAHVGKSFVLTCEVLVAGQKEKSKVLNTVYLNNVAGDVATLGLGKTDCFRIKQIVDVTSGNPATYVDVTGSYDLDSGVRDNYYALGAINLKAGLPTPDPGTLLDIEFDYFSHSGTGSYFSVDSYTSIINDPDIDFDYTDIPSYTAKDGTVYTMAEAFDFRSTVGADGSFTGTGAILGPVPVSQSNIIFDVEYYLPRIDTLTVNENGKFLMVKGVPSLNPVKPAAGENSMALYNLYINAYTDDVKAIKASFIENKRYTMRDIGRLEKRISNLEYYVTFNMLEKATSELSILDGNGADRFKNGFLVDNFKDFIASNTASNEFSAALDTAKGELRPSFYTRSVKLELDEGASSGYQKTSDMVTLPYTNVVWQSQLASSKTISVNPYFIFEYEGMMILSPNSDVWKDVDTQPDLVVDIDTGIDALRDVANEAGILGTTWGNWNTTDTRSSTTGNVTQNTRAWAQGGGWWRGSRGGVLTTTRSTATTTTQTDQLRTGINKSIQTEIEQSSLGENVTSVNLIPFIRSIPVQFAATNMKPNTKVYAYFDDVDVTLNCRAMNSQQGTSMVTDSNGNITGVFVIPNTPDKRFFTGTRVFRLTNSATDSRDPDELLTSAQAEYFAGGLAETRRETVLSVRRPALIERDVSENRTLTSTTTTSRTTTQRTQLWNFPALLRAGGSGDDPLAQSFIVDEADGIFITEIELFFSEKAATIPVWFQIRNMVNGYPGKVILPYSEVTLQPDSVNVDALARVGTKFKFEAPVYLQPDEEYCFVVGSSTADYRIHVSRLGDTDVASGVSIQTQPHLGSLFKSQNDRTWTAEQFEDIKFVMKRAEFNINQDMKLVFKNTATADRFELGVNPFETEASSQSVRVYHKSHGLTVNDKVKIDLFGDTWFEAVLTSGHLVVGQQLTSGTGSGIIAELEHPGINGAGNDIYRVKLRELTGYFAPGVGFSGGVTYETFRNPEILNTLGIIPKNLVHNIALGNFPGGVDNTLNGIPLDDFSTPVHLVQHVDSMDSFIIQVGTPATASGRTGGTGSYATGNVQVDTFNLQATYIDYTGEAAWTYSGIKHKGVGSSVVNYDVVPTTSFEPNTDVDLVEPMKIANKDNESMYLGAGNKSLTVVGTLKSDNGFVTPVVNLDSISFTTVTNRIEYNTCENYSVAPNAGTWTTDCDEEGSTARWLGEEQSSGGSEGAKYIMQPVTLKNPASNLKVIVDVLRTLDNDVEVYYRTLPAELESDIVNMPWVKQAFDVEVVSEHDTDFVEAEVTIPADNTAALPEFKAFQIKLVMRSKNSARPPKCKNFRAIAVT